jgi:CBS-domain-containing membrane protein
MITNRTKAILINATLVTACVVQLARGYRFVVIAVTGITFFLVANAIVLLKVRADRRRHGQVSRFAMHEPGYGKPAMRQSFTPRERDEHRMDGPR